MMYYEGLGKKSKAQPAPLMPVYTPPAPSPIARYAVLGAIGLAVIGGGYLLYKKFKR